MMVHVRMIVSGLVQGVSYRAATRLRAHHLGVKGIVRNEPNGDVYIEAEAEEEILHRFIKWCNEGPPLAEVEKVDLELGPLKNYADFQIIR